MSCLFHAPVDSSRSFWIACSSFACDPAGAGFGKPPRQSKAETQISKKARMFVPSSTRRIMCAQCFHHTTRVERSDWLLSMIAAFRPGSEISLRTPRSGATGGPVVGSATSGESSASGRTQSTRSSRRSRTLMVPSYCAGGSTLRGFRARSGNKLCCGLPATNLESTRPSSLTIFAMARSANGVLIRPRLATTSSSRTCPSGHHRHSSSPKC